MYFLFVSTDVQNTNHFIQALQLSGSGTTLVTIDNGFDVIRHLQDIIKNESYPDLIILSLLMNRINGKILLELLKTDDMYRLIPVLMFFPEKNEEEERFCEKLGARTMPLPLQQQEWNEAARKMCAFCD